METVDIGALLAKVKQEWPSQEAGHPHSRRLAPQHHPPDCCRCTQPSTQNPCQHWLLQQTALAADSSPACCQCRHAFLGCRSLLSAIAGWSAASKQNISLPPELTCSLRRAPSLFNAFWRSSRPFMRGILRSVSAATKSVTTIRSLIVSVPDLQQVQGQCEQQTGGEDETAPGVCWWHARQGCVSAMLAY